MATHDYTRMSIDVPKKEHRKLKVIAAMRGVSMKQIILEALSQKLYSDNVPNAETERVLRESDEGKNLTTCKDFNDFRSQLGI